MSNRNFGLADNQHCISLYDDSIAILDSTGVDESFRIGFVNSGGGPRIIQGNAGIVFGLGPSTAPGFVGYDGSSIPANNITLLNDGDSVVLAFDIPNGVWQATIKSFLPGMKNPMTAMGDMIVAGPNGTPVQLPVAAIGGVLVVSNLGDGPLPTWLPQGLNGQVLTVVTRNPIGVEWAEPGAPLSHYVAPPPGT